MPNPAPRIIVSGFWRSGTTWLQRIIADAVCARTAFEPFSAGNPTYSGLLDSFYDVRTGAEREVLFPHLDGGAAPAELEEYARKEFAGRGNDPFLFYNDRTGDRDACDIVVAKETRTAFSLRWLRQAFPSAAIVHVSRDPRAILASMQRYDGHIARDPRGLLKREKDSDSWWLATDCDFTRVICDQPDGRANLCAPYKEAIRASRGLSNPEKIGILWAISEDRALKSLSDMSGACQVVYEDIVSDPERAISAVGQISGEILAGDVDFAAPSFTASPGRQSVSSEQFRHSWKTELSENDAIGVVRGVSLVNPSLLYRFSAGGWSGQNGLRGR